jgi:hypothetical protein
MRTMENGKPTRSTVAALSFPSPPPLAVLAGILLLLSALPVHGETSVEVVGGASLEAGAPAPKGGLLLCTNIAEKDPFQPLLRAAVRHLKPESVLTFRNDDLSTVRGSIEEKKPEAVIVVAPPGTIDLTFHLKAMALCLAVDDDPFPDFVLGYLTGATPEEGTAFLKAAQKAAALKGRHPRTHVETGPGIASRFDSGGGTAWCPRLKSRTLLHADPTFLHKNRGALEGVGFLTFFGESTPWGVESGVESTFLRESQLRLTPAVILSGESDLATVDYHYPKGVGEAPGRIGPSDSFCLASLSLGPGALLLALGPGLPLVADQEMERICLLSESVGEAVQGNMVASILHHGKGDARELLSEKHWAKPRDVPLLSRAFARVVFGDPRLTPCVRSLAPPPFAVKTRKKEDGIHIRCVGADLGRFTLRSDPFSKDKGRDRVFLSVILPDKERKPLKRLDVVELKSGNRFPKIAIARAGIERRKGSRILHILFILDSMGGTRILSRGGKLEGKFLLAE